MCVFGRDEGWAGQDGRSRGPAILAHTSGVDVDISFIGDTGRKDAQDGRAPPALSAAQCWQSADPWVACLPGQPTPGACLPWECEVHRYTHLASPPQRTHAHPYHTPTSIAHPPALHTHSTQKLAGSGSLQPECQPTLQSRFQGPQPTAGPARFMGPWVLPPPPSVPPLFPPPGPSPTLFAGLPTRAADLGSLRNRKRLQVAPIYLPARRSCHSHANQPTNHPSVLSQP